MGLDITLKLESAPTGLGSNPAPEFWTIELEVSGSRGRRADGWEIIHRYAPGAESEGSITLVDSDEIVYALTVLGNSWFVALAAQQVEAVLRMRSTDPHEPEPYRLTISWC